MQPATASDHVIRLRGPWTFLLETGQATEAVRQPFTKPLPERWRSSEARVVAKRKFNSPSGLSPVERVRLVLHRRGALAAVLLNDEPLSLSDEQGAWLEWNITSLLVPFNELRVQFSTQSIDSTTLMPPLAQVELRIGT